MTGCEDAWYIHIMKYWLIKSEADCYSIDDLKRDGSTPWEGVRNYQARNYMRDMSVGDLALFYHSNSKPLGIAGIARVVQLAHPDETQFRLGDEYYDAKSKRDKPIWECVDFGFMAKFDRVITLGELKLDPNTAGMVVCQTGGRLSVQPVLRKHFDYILKLVPYSDARGQD